MANTAPSKPHEPKLPAGDVLIGTGERSVKLGFVVINVYSLGLYVDPDPTRECLLDKFGDSDHNDLLSDPTFYPAFSSGHFRKTFRLTFCRALTKAKMVGGFDDALRSRCDDAHQGDADLLLSKLVPTSGVVEDDVLALVCEGDGKTLTCTHFPSGGGGGAGGTELVRLESGGEGGAWQALQNIYFDDDTALPTVRVSAVADLPDVLVRGSAVGAEGGVDGAGGSGGGGSGSGTSSGVGVGVGAGEVVSSRVASDISNISSIVGGGGGGVRQPSAKEIEDAVDEKFVQGSLGKKKKKKMKWSKFAGRDPAKGGEGYKFGDVTLGVVGAMGLRKKKGEAGAAAQAVTPPPPDVADGKEKSDGAAHDRGFGTVVEEDERVQKKMEELDVRDRKLRRELARTAYERKEVDQALLLYFFFTLVLSDLVSLFIGVSTEASALKVSGARLVFSVSGCVLASVRYIYSRRDEEAKTKKS